MTDKNHSACPLCGGDTVQAAVSSGAFAVSVSLYADVRHGHVLGPDTVSREIDTCHSTWLNARVCTACGHAALFAEDPGSLAPKDNNEE